MSLPYVLIHPSKDRKYTTSNLIFKVDFWSFNRVYQYFNMFLFLPEPLLCQCIYLCCSFAGHQWWRRVANERLVNPRSPADRRRDIFSSWWTVLRSTWLQDHSQESCITGKHVLVIYMTAVVCQQKMHAKNSLFDVGFQTFILLIDFCTVFII